MTSLFLTVCRLSLSGSLLLLALLVIRRIFRDSLPKSCYYYLWLLVLLRFLLPLSSPLPSLAVLEEALPAAVSSSAEAGAQPWIEDAASAGYMDKAGIITEINSYLVELNAKKERLPLRPMLADVWLAVALALLLRDVFVYARFQRCLRKSKVSIDDPQIQELYAQTGAALGIKKLPALYKCAAPTPMLNGLFKSALLLPESLLSTAPLDLQCFFLHELIHYRRRDILYKWAVLLCLRLHWFNPLVYTMRWEINALAELSCDARALVYLTPPEKARYGNSLLAAIENQTPKVIPAYGALWTNEVKLMKARFEQIMNHKKEYKKYYWAAVCAIALILGACGILTGPSATDSISDIDKEEITPASKETVGDIPAITAEDIDISESAANAKTASETFERIPIRWVDPAFETLVREKLAKPQGVIYQDELYDIAELKLFFANYRFSDDEDKLEWPLNGDITSLYGYRATGYHSGLDIGCPSGTTLAAAEDGIVIFAEYFENYGNLIKIDHGDTIETWYAHLQDFAVSVGDTVSRGQTIGSAGASGQATGSHLHLEVCICGKHQDPLKFLKPVN